MAKAKECKTEVITFFVEPSIKAAIIEQHELYGISTSEFMRRAVQERLERIAAKE